MSRVSESSDQQSAAGSVSTIRVRAAYGRIWQLESLPLWSYAYVLAVLVSISALVLSYFIGRAIGLSFPRALEQVMRGDLATLANIITTTPIFLSLVAVLPIVAWGTTRLQLNIIDGDGKFSDLWSLLVDGSRGALARWTRIGQFLLFQCAFYILYDLGGAIMLLGVLLRSTSIVGIGFLTAMVWWAVRIRFSFTYCFMVDQGCGGFEALRRSWRATKRQWLRLVTLVLVVPVVLIMANAVMVSLVLEGIEMSGRVVGEIEKSS